MPRELGHDRKRRRIYNGAIPENGFLRLIQIVGRPGNPEADPPIPPIPPIIPVSKSTWWAGVKSGRFPAPTKLGPRTTVWTVESIRRLIESA